jgi:hypothetical protein
MARPTGKWRIGLGPNTADYLFGFAGRLGPVINIVPVISGDKSAIDITLQAGSIRWRQRTGKDQYGEVTCQSGQSEALGPGCSRLGAAFP